MGLGVLCPCMFGWVWRLLTCFGDVPGCGGCCHFGVNFRVYGCCCEHQVHAARFRAASMCQVHLDLFLDLGSATMSKVTCSGLGMPLD